MTAPKEFTCGRDGTTRTRAYCLACELYNAAVVAQQAAALYIAQRKLPRSRVTSAWLNEHGVFAETATVSAIQVGSSDEAEPFAMLTSQCRSVVAFMARQKP